MSKPVLTPCFILNCQNKVNRSLDDLTNVYCNEHSKYNNTDLDFYRNLFGL